jgi:hypothetical protein
LLVHIWNDALTEEPGEGIAALLNRYGQPRLGTVDLGSYTPQFDKLRPGVVPARWIALVRSREASPHREPTVNRRPTLLAAIALTAAAALSLSACGSDDSSKDKDNDKIAGADTGSETSASPSASSSTADAKRPAIKLPSDLHYAFEWKQTGDADKDAVLHDGELFIKATDQAIANQDPLDPAYRFYSEGELAAATQEYVQRFVDHKARTTGTYRFYGESVTIRKDGTASLSYCEDQGKAFNKYVDTGKVEKTPVTKNSYILYNTVLKKNADGVWVTQDMLSDRGSSKCQP